MTKEEKINYAIKELKGIIEFEESHGDRNYFDYCGCITIGSAKMAIKVLEQQTCEDAVSREAVLGLFAQNADATRPYSKTWEEVKDLPSVNPQPKTKTGHWIDCGSYYRCSECDNWVDEVDGMPKFCDECGMKMVDEEVSE